MRYLNRAALEALKHGTANGTIQDTEEQIIDIIDEQEVVSYCSKVGSYTFDCADIVDEDFERAMARGEAY